MIEQDKLDRLQRAVTDWMVDRPIMDKNNTPHALIALLAGELKEFEDAVNGVGDAAIKDQRANIEQEFADLMVFMLSLSSKLGIDVYAVTMEKMAFNMARYNAVFFQDGDYAEARKKVKQLEQENHMKREFYGD